jgi:hypothetical protein
MVRMQQRSQGGARRAEDMSGTIRTMDFANSKAFSTMKSAFATIHIHKLR